MTKADLIKTFAEATCTPQAVAHEYLDRLMDICAAELLGGGEILLPGLGKLVVEERAARKGRNPRTGEVIEVAARRTVKFKMAKNLKESLV